MDEGAAHDIRRSWGEPRSPRANGGAQKYSFFFILPRRNMDWLYVWSPRYRFFHEVLYSRIQHLQGLRVHPVFADQHLFNRLSEDGHFLAGIPVKTTVIVNYIRQNLGKTFFFTDVDLIVMPSFTILDLLPYTTNEITTMREWSDNPTPNIGCLLSRCTPETLAFFERMLLRILRDKDADQDAFIKELSSFSGTVGTFSADHFLQSHMFKTKEVDPYQMKIVQCIVGQDKPTDIIAEKVCMIDQFMKIEPFKQYLPEDVYVLLYGNQLPQPSQPPELS